MKLLKFVTPFLLFFPLWMILAGMAWFGKFKEYNILPQQGILLIAIGFTMVIIDLFIKYFIGKNKVQYVWLIEIMVIVVLCIMIIPQLSHIIYV